jgi:hypothetical protein
MSDSPDLTRLRQAVRESRLGISREYAGLVTALDLRTRFTQSVRRHPLGWIGGAAAAGLVATLFGGRTSRKSSTKPSPLAAPGNTSAAPNPLSKAGWIAAALELGKLLYPILRPVVVEYVSNAAQEGLARRGRHP